MLVRFFIINVKENDAWKGEGIAEEDMCGIIILCKYILWFMGERWAEGLRVSGGLSKGVGSRGCAVKAMVMSDYMVVSNR